MASKSKGIADIVKKVKVLLLDIEGTTTSISFVKDELFPYAEENVHSFLESQWEKEEVKEAVSALRKLALEDQENSVEGLVTIPGEDASKMEQIEGLVGNVKWQMAADRKAGALKQLQGLIWKQGYDSGDIKGHVFEDVGPALEHWRSADSRKVYIYSSGSVQAQKLLFAQSSAGDLLKYIDGHFDTAVGPKQESASYIKIVKEIGCQPGEVLFLTDIVKEAEAAQAAGLHAALVVREGNAQLPVDDAAQYPVLWSLAQLANNKRKADDEPEHNVKVLKTDTLEAKPETKTDSNEEPSAKTEADKMEVEDEPSAAENKTEEPKAPKVDAVTLPEIVIEEVTKVSKPVESLEVEPIVEETPDEHKTKETEKMDTADETAGPKKENGVTEEAVMEESPPKVITEIKEITDDKLDEVADIIEDIVPVVEEPQTDEVDMAELQNVGEVLEKECDEILSKVQDVTNLDSISVKPMLNTISEENMENENLDTNDIVERILDSEQELEAEMECGDIDLNTVSEVVDEKKPEETKGEDKEEITKPSSDVKKIDTKTEDSKVEDSSAKESTDTADTTEVVEEAAQKQEESNKTDETKPEETAKPEEKSESSEKEVPSETETNVEITTEDKATESKPEEPKVNGNATNSNGDALNGDASKNDNVNSRLVAENGKEVVNGADGKTNGSEENKEKVEPEVSDIKVKTVAAAETRTDPIEPATEA